MTYTEAMAAIKDHVVHAAIFEERERLYCAIQDAVGQMTRHNDDEAFDVLERTLSDSELT